MHNLPFKNFLLNPLWGLGLVIRILLVTIFTHDPVLQWYVPFMNMSLIEFSLDPWAVWLAHGGVLEAFPYGYGMWLYLLPFITISSIFSFSGVYGYFFAILVADMLMLIVLDKIFPGKTKLLLLLYWLSPIVVLASYSLGFNDLIPASFLVTSLYCLQIKKFKSAGVLCSLAISIKISMALAWPFFILYFVGANSLRKFLREFLRWQLVTMAILLLPYVLSNSAMTMLFGVVEVQNIFNPFIAFGPILYLMSVPLILLIMLYLAWRVRRLRFEVLLSIIGITFLLIMLFTPLTLGWCLWAVPFLVLHQVTNTKRSLFFVSLFSVIYSLLMLMLNPQLLFSNGASLLLTWFNPVVVPFLYTILIAFGVIIALHIWQDAIRQNIFFRFSCKPFVIGIAGDSASGKDTLADALVGLFGSHSVAKISGDDYHRWDRQKPMWDVITHLNPMANNLEAYSRDLSDLANGKKIMARHYDHSIGKFTKPFQMKSKDFIVASGLHALYYPITRDTCDLKIYMDIDERLRRFFKVKRDRAKRGHPVQKILDSINKRMPDFERFIKPQAEFADVILSLQPLHPDRLDDLKIGTGNIPLRLAVKTRNQFNEDSLIRVLSGICGLYVDVSFTCSNNQTLTIIEGDIAAADIAMAARLLCPDGIEFLDIPPIWEDGMLGLMQLIVLSHIQQLFTRRFT